MSGTNPEDVAIIVDYTCHSCGTKGYSFIYPNSPKERRCPDCGAVVLNPDCPMKPVKEDNNGNRN